MLKINHEREVEWPFTSHVPADGDTAEDREVSVRYKLVKRLDWHAPFGKDRSLPVWHW